MTPRQIISVRDGGSGGSGGGRQSLALPRHPSYVQRRLRFWFWFFGIAAIILGTVMIISSVKASSNADGDSCSRATATSATGGILEVLVAPRAHGLNSAFLPDVVCQDDQGAGNVNDANYIGYDVPAGSRMDFECVQHSSGTTPPTTTQVVISGYSDNSNLGGGGSPIWTETFTSCSTSENTTTFTHYMTVDGTVSGSVRAGIQRVFVRICSTTGASCGSGVTSFDCNSDATSETAPTGGNCGGTVHHEHGVARSNPGFTAPNMTGTSPCGAGCTTYIGGDTITTSITANATSYASGTRGTSLLKSDSGGFNLLGAAWSLSVGAITQSAAIQGSASLWTPGALTAEWVETGGSSVNNFAGLSYWTYTTQTIPGSMTLVDANHATWVTGDTLSRSLTPSSCTLTIDGASMTTANRGSFANMECNPWKDARGNNIANNVNGQGYYQKAGDFECYCDFPSVNTTFGPQGNLPTNLQAKFSGCAAGANPPDAPGCATQTTGLNYHKMVETCAATCTANEANLWNWGNTTGQFDVNATYPITSITTSKTNLGANTTFYTIGSDNEFVRLNAIHEYGSGSVFIISLNTTCVRTDPNGNVFTGVSMGSTDASGNSNVVQFGVVAPSGLWTYACTGQMQGNSASYTFTVTFVSPYTADLVIPVLWNVTYNSTASASSGHPMYDVNVSAGLRRYDPVSGTVIRLIPDNIPQLTIEQYDAATDLHDIMLVQKAVMRQEDTIGSVFDYKFQTNNTNLTPDVFGYVAFNFTGAPVMGSSGFILKENVNGNFTGNFTGNVTDMSAIPPTLSIPGYFLFLMAAGVFIAQLSRNNPVPGFIGAVLELMGLGLATDQQANLPGNYQIILMVLFLGAFLGLAAQTFFVARGLFLAGPKEGR